MWHCKDISPGVHLQSPGLLQLSFVQRHRQLTSTTTVCIQNAAARLITQTGRREHISPVRNCTACLSDNVSTSNWQHWCLRRYTAAHRRISQTRASRRLRPVAISARLVPSHASYRGPELAWATGHLMSPDHGFGTSCLLHCGHLTVSANSEDSWKRYCFSRTRLRHLVTLAYRHQI